MKLIRNLLLLLLALAVAAVLVLAFLPARTALGFIGGRLGPVELGEVTGTLWKGQAHPASVNGTPIGTLGWTLHPLSLLGARVNADVSLAGDIYNGGGNIDVQRDRTIRVRDLQLTMPANKLQPLVDIPALVFRGDIRIDIAFAELRGGFPTQVQGRAAWKNASVAGSAEAQFGELSTEFATAPGGGIAGTVSDNGGPLQAQGTYTASLVGYDADIALRARDGNPQVLEALQYIGEPQPDGSARLVIRGRLLGEF